MAPRMFRNRKTGAVLIKPPTSWAPQAPRRPRYATPKVPARGGIGPNAGVPEVPMGGGQTVRSSGMNPAGKQTGWRRKLAGFPDSDWRPGLGAPPWAGATETAAASPAVTPAPATEDAETPAPAAGEWMRRGKPPRSERDQWELAQYTKNNGHMGGFRYRRKPVVPPVGETPPVTTPPVVAPPVVSPPVAPPITNPPPPADWVPDEPPEDD